MMSVISGHVDEFKISTILRSQFYRKNEEKRIGRSLKVI